MSEKLGARLIWVKTVFSVMNQNRICSEIRHFADDDCVCYREIGNLKVTLKLQEDKARLGCWAKKWGMRFFNQSIAI